MLYIHQVMTIVTELRTRLPYFTVSLVDVVCLPFQVEGEISHSPGARHLWVRLLRGHLLPARRQRAPQQPEQGTTHRFN